jgi:hypothetical protein
MIASLKIFVNYIAVYYEELDGLVVSALRHAIAEVK